MSTVFANTIDNNPIYAQRAEQDAAGNDIQQTYATKAELPAAQVQSDWDATTGMGVILNKPTLATVATTGDYDDLTDKPDLSIYAQSSSLATVATTGDYEDLLNKPSIPAAQVNSDWESTSGVSEILHKPDLSIYAQSSSLATVATTGDYDDLLNKPTIPAAQVQTDWDATTGMGAILNKPTLATVATTGDYDDLTDKPDLSIYQEQLTAGSNITIQNNVISASAAPQVNADWEATSGVAEILHKPIIGNLAAGTGITITESGSTVTISADAVAQVNADWDATSGVAEILNKPTLATVATTGDYDDLTDKPDLSIYAQSSSLATVATTGAYSDLSGTPTINNVPAVTSSDDDKVLKASYSGGVGSYSWETAPSGQVNSDWEATSGVQEILNKPDLVDIVAGPGIVVDNPDGNTLRVSMAADYEVTLFESTTAETTINLSESIYNFERGYVVCTENDTVLFRMDFLVTQGNPYITVGCTYYLPGVANPLRVLGQYYNISNNGATITAAAGKCKSFDSSGNNNVVGAYKVVGIHRIANN